MADFKCRDEKLLPCPFCGSEGFLTARWSNYAKHYLAFVACSFCEAQSGTHTVTYFDGDVWDDAAFTRVTDSWNRRFART